MMDSNYECKLVDVEGDTKDIVIHGYDMDDLICQINKAEDIETLDGIYNKLKKELEQKFELLKIVQKQNAEMESILHSNKYLSELDEMQMAEQCRADSLLQMIEAKRVELELLHHQQVEDLVQFEHDVQQISEKLMDAPKDDFESTTLMQAMLQLRKDLEEKVGELSQYRDELRIAGRKFKQNQLDEGFSGYSLKHFEESIGDINVLNEKLTLSVEQMTEKVNTLRVEINHLNLLN